MTNQKSREIVYFKAPIFLVDLSIHVLTLFFLVKTMPAGYFNGLVQNGHLSTSVYSLLAISFCIAISVFNLRLHERQIKLRIVVWRAMKQTISTYIMFTVLMALVMKSSPRMVILSQVGITLPLIALIHYFANKAVRNLRRLGHNMRNVVIVGTDPVSFDLYEELILGQSFRAFINSSA